jgi:molybdate transport system substrate-binding protein
MKCTLIRRLVVLLLIAATGCAFHDNQNPTDSSKKPARITTILVAASAKNAIEAVAAQFEKETGNPVVVSAGPSNALANQIISGGKADLFLSANKQWAEAVADAGQSVRQRALLTNDLVLVVPKGNPAAVNSPDDLNSDRVRKIALAGEKVPAGMYAHEALTALTLFDNLERSKKIVRGHDVRSTLTYIERGEADAGIVYSTDAKMSQDVEVVYTFDPATYERIIYPLMLLEAADGNPAAVRFFDYLGSPPAEQVFRRYGFETSPE